MNTKNTEVFVGTSLPAGHGSVPTPGAGLPAATIALAEFSNAINPFGPVERFLVEEMSRCAIRTREVDAALDALRDDGEAALQGMLENVEGVSGAKLGLARASVLGSERHETLLRQSTASARGFLRALQALREGRASHHVSGLGNILLPDPRFATEPACLAHLVRRYVYGKSRCRRCGAAATGSFVAARVSWQCSRCHAQTGLRCGTCMERSPLPLTQWFAAIRMVLLLPAVQTEEVAVAIKIDRRQSVRNMIKRIQCAMNSHDPTAALAGLDELYLGIG